ncbi:MAG: hypothetical protein JXB24_04250 [Bacteroidales bacterium]|nr:hypothetical protein [Bacteroidales bacterium]
MIKKICIVQIENFHTEVILPQLDICESSHEIITYTPAHLQGILDFRNYAIKKQYYVPLYKYPRLLDTLSKCVLLRNIHYLVSVIRLAFILNKEHTDIVVFNTVTNALKARLISGFIIGVKKLRIVHHVSSQSFKLNGLFDKNIVLSKAVFENSQLFQEPSADYFEPVIFNKIISPSIRKPGVGNCMHIGVIGKTDFKKRNYIDLFSVLERKCKTAPHVKFHLIGETDAAFVEEIKKRNIGNSVIYKQGYTPFHEMLQNVSTMDAIAFLIDPCVDQFSLYNVIKISGAANIAKYFNMPLFVHKDFIKEDVLKNNYIEYEDSIGEIIAGIQSGVISLGELEGKRMAIHEYECYMAHQRERFLQILNSM